ncbi:MAG TPA: hypothetical protein PLP17_08995, partial [Oligoflexia bacterium]|nr:hypothetical protein [Oligoflexia bacterium]
SDVFNQDMCVFVEGATDVVFFEHVIRNLYADEFKRVAVGVLQYGGGAADAILSGAIDVCNISAGQKFVLWIRDRDAPATSPPSSNSNKFKNKLVQSGAECHILEQREIEFYFPQAVVKEAQQGDEAKEQAASAILLGNQTEKFAEAAKDKAVVPGGKLLRRLLRKHLTSRDQLPNEIRKIVEDVLFGWRDCILGI